MLKKLQELEKRYEELEELLSDPSILANYGVYQKHAREHAGIADIVQAYREYRRIESQIEGNKGLLRDGDEELRELAKEELPHLREKLEDLEERLKILLIPEDPNDARNVFLEIRAGTGGDEAGLFAEDLFRMYARYAERSGWRVEMISSSLSGGIGGFKEVILLIEGQGAYSRLKYESGVHRVQRVPVTEAQGRIHTSAVTVAVLPEADEVEVNIDPNELRIDVYRSTGHGGQSVNTTDSAVRIVHVPSGIIVQCQAERSQHKNRDKAMKMLRAKLYEYEQDKKKQAAEQFYGAKGEIAWGHQIRSYVLQPYTMVKDHRTDTQNGNTQSVLDGNIGDFIEAYLKIQKKN